MAQVTPMTRTVQAMEMVIRMVTRTVMRTRVMIVRGTMRM
jgi:hypothetical protein